MVPNSMWSFQGKPTIFGNPTCDEDFRCSFSEVIQFDLASNTWEVLGNMLRSRRYHEVIEVPVSVCEDFTSTLTPPITTEEPSPFDVTAALLIGGFNPDREGGNILNEVEVFGCPNPVSIPSYPFNTYFPGATFVRDENDGHVLVCGGFECNEEMIGCFVSKQCYTWEPQSNSWQPAAPLPEMSWNHLLTQIPKPTQPDESLSPVIIGSYANASLIYNSNEDAWEEYLDLPQGRPWISSGCLLQYDGLIYSIWESLLVLDPSADPDENTFAFSEEDPVPSPFATPGKCAIIQEDEVASRYHYIVDTHNVSSTALQNFFK